MIFYEGDLNQTRLRVYSTLPVLCDSDAVNCSLSFQISTIETVGNEDLIRISGCADNDCSGSNY